MQVGDTSVDVPQESKREAQKKMVEELKVQWKLMWAERFNDKAKAEGVSINDYSSLRVNRGTVIHATRSFKALNFSDIVKEHLAEDADRFIQPSVSEGGWNKFIKTNITNSPQRKKRADTYVPAKSIDQQQPKKGGRGWLHST